MKICTVNTTNAILNVCNQVNGRDRFAYNPFTGKRVDQLVVNIPKNPDWEDNEMCLWLLAHKRIANKKGIVMNFSVKNLSTSCISVGRK